MSAFVTSLIGFCSNRIVLPVRSRDLRPAQHAEMPEHRLLRRLRGASVTCTCRVM